MHTSWIPTPIEELQALDIVLFTRAIWVIQRISRHSGGQTFHATRVDDGKQTTWNFLPHSHGFLIERKQTTY